MLFGQPISTVGLRLLWTLVMCLVAEAAIAKEPRRKTNKIKKRNSVQTLAATSPSMTEMTAEADSSPKYFGAALRGGLVLGTIPGGGLDVYYPASKKLQLGVQYLVGQEKFTDDADDALSIDDTITSDATLTAQTAMLRARYFLWSSLNLSAGIGQRLVDWEINVVEERDDGLEIHTRGNVSSTVINLCLGNTWQFDSGFFIGADWVGYQVVIIQGKASSSTETNGFPSADAEEMAEDNEQLGKDLGATNAVQLPLLNIGWQF